jgi:TPR repeat protein
MVAADHARALKLFVDAAQSGYTPAQQNLAEFYLHGHCMPKDYVSAYGWLSLLSKSDERARAELSSIREHLSNTELAEAEHRAELWGKAAH